mmetsp:Transcript_5450/g.10972  ORF Transcript_5450/g.10972 Transcript_5450/m.10972 type:complete len:195 (-) Transcript_5450:206-790(-)
MGGCQGGRTKTRTRITNINTTTTTNIAVRESTSLRESRFTTRDEGARGLFLAPHLQRALRTHAGALRNPKPILTLRASNSSNTTGHNREDQLSPGHCLSLSCYLCLSPTHKHTQAARLSEAASALGRRAIPCVAVPPFLEALPPLLEATPPLFGGVTAMAPLLEALLSLFEAPPPLLEAPYPFHHHCWRHYHHC